MSHLCRTPLPVARKRPNGRRLTNNIKDCL